MSRKHYQIKNNDLSHSDVYHIILNSDINRDLFCLILSTYLGISTFGWSLIRVELHTIPLNDV